jgi:hypothetical protein
MAKNGDSGSKAASAGVGRAFLACVILIAVFVGVDLLLKPEDASFKREGGGIETVSAVLYIVAAGVFFLRAPRSLWGRLFHVPALMVLFACRELDFDKAFTEAGVLSLRLYSGDAALATKLIAGSVALFSVFVILRNAWVGLPAGLRALRAGEHWPWYAFGAGGLVVLTKSIDGLGRKLLGVGVEISGKIDQVAALVEEVGEVFIPVCAILAMVSCWRRT